MRFAAESRTPLKHDIWLPFAVLIIAAIVWAYVLLRRKPPAPEPPEIQMHVATYEVAVDKWGAKYFIATMPDGTQPVAGDPGIMLGGPGLPVGTMGWIQKPGEPPSALVLPIKVVADEHEKGTTFRLEVPRP